MMAALGGHAAMVRAITLHVTLQYFLVEAQSHCMFFEALLVTSLFSGSRGSNRSHFSQPFDSPTVTFTVPR